MTTEEKLLHHRNMMSSYKKDSRIKECFHHNKSECKGKIKQAHSLQRNGRLSIIESEVNGNQCVYTFTNHRVSEKKFIEDLIPLGKKEASTFFGFCDFHDTNLFSPIENNPFDNSSEHLFLHSYRSYAHSFHRKMEEIGIYENNNSEFVKFLPKEIIQTFKEGHEMAKKDYLNFRPFLDRALENKEYDYLHYLVYEKEGLYPFGVSSQMCPRVTYKNFPMNNHMDADIPWSQPIITFLPDRDTTFVILAAFPNDKMSIQLLDELNDLSDQMLEIAITSLIIANCENTFISPKVWQKLSKSRQRLMIDEFIVNTNSAKYHKTFFKSNFNFFSPEFEMSKL
jgi:hypothetical protein